MACLAAGCAPEADEDDAAEEGELEVVQVRAALSTPAFSLVSATSGKALTGGTLSKDTLVTQTSLKSVVFDNQRWVFDGQTARLTPATKPNLCMEPETTAPFQIRLRTCNGSALQAWKLRLSVLNGRKFARYENFSTHQLLDNGGSNSEGAAAVTFAENGTNNQLFERRF
jgi:hypothetical protein